METQLTLFSGMYSLSHFIAIGWCKCYAGPSNVNHFSECHKIQPKFLLGLKKNIFHQ